MLGNVNVLLQYNKNILLLLNAVQTIIITHCRGAGQQQQKQAKHLSPMSEYQQLLIGTETLEHCSIELWISVKVGIRNNSGYTCIGIINIQYILQCPLTKHLRCPLSISTISSMSIVQINYCRYQSFPISKLINIKGDHSTLCCQTNITRQQPMFQMLNKKSIATRLHMFFSCRRIRRNLFYFISPSFIRDSPQFGQRAVRLSFPSCSPCYNIQKR